MWQCSKLSMPPCLADALQFPRRAGIGPGASHKARDMNEKTLRALVDAGAIKRSRIIGRGGRFHIEFDTATATLTASTNRDTVKEWVSLDAAARWLRALGIGAAQLEIAQWTPEQKRLGLS
jgi:hypothetical protein